MYIILNIISLQHCYGDELWALGGSKHGNEGFVGKQVLPTLATSSISSSTTLLESTTVLAPTLPLPTSPVDTKILIAETVEVEAGDHYGDHPSVV